MAAVESYAVEIYEDLVIEDLSIIVCLGTEEVKGGLPLTFRLRSV